jgi:hypothetical protein
MELAGIRKERRLYYLLLLLIIMDVIAPMTHVTDYLMSQLEYYQQMHFKQCNYIKVMIYF